MKCRDNTNNHLWQISDNKYEWKEDRQGCNNRYTGNIILTLECPRCGHGKETKIYVGGVAE